MVFMYAAVLYPPGTVILIFPSASVSQNIRGFLNALQSWQFGKRLYVMVRRLPNRLIAK